MRRSLPLVAALALLAPALASAQARGTAILSQVGLPVLPDNVTVAMKPSTRAWCLTAPSATKGTVLTLSACTPLQSDLPASQRFTLVRMGTGPIRHASGLCVDVRQTDGKLLLWDCHGGWNQQFTNTRGDELKLAKNNTCIDVPNGRAGEGVQPTAYACHGAVNQRWLQTSK